MKLQKVNERVAYIVSKLKKKRVNFDDIQFTGDNQKYFITGVKADKGHEELKVYYKWENEGTEYEVDFFDFHNEYFERLLVLIESQLFILGF